MSSFDLDHNEAFGVKQFDVVVGNPPYQETLSNNKLYPKFLKIAINSVKYNGYIMLVTPVAVIKAFTGSKLANQTFDRFTDLNVKLINFNINHYFKIGVEVCYFCIQSGKKFNPMVQIINKQGKSAKIDLDNDFVVTFQNKIEKSIFKKCFSKSNNRFKLSHSVAGNRFQPSKDGYYIGVSNIDSLGHITQERGNKVSEWEYFDSKKIIVRIFGEQIIYDRIGNIVSIKDNLMSCIIRSDRDFQLIEDLLVSKLYKWFLVVSNEKRSQYVSFISKIRDFGEYTAENVYQYYNLTQKEIDYIENYFK